MLRQFLSLPFQKFFLIDGLGALLTAFLTGIILPTFEQYFGMPRDVLYVLAGLAMSFAVYSFFCYKRVSQNWQAYLKAIAVANFLYCCATAFLVYVYFEELSTLGVLYFVGEIALVLGLVMLEWKKSSTDVS